MSDATEASKIVRYIQASGALGEFRRSKRRIRRRFKGGYVRESVGGGKWFAWIIACVLWAILGAAWVAL